MTLQVENVNMGYTSVAYQLLGTDEDYSETGATYGLLTSTEEEDGTITFEVSDITVFYDGRERRMEALQSLVREARKAGQNPMAIWTWTNIWFVPKELDDPARTGWPSESKDRRSGRQVVIVDAAGAYVVAGRNEVHPDLELQTHDITVNTSFGLLPAQMFAAIRGTKPPACYLCRGQETELRTYGPVLTETNTFSGLWTCSGLDSCGVRADRKFTKAQQQQHIRKAFKTLIAWAPEGLRPELRVALGGLVGGDL